ncbi:MAG: hypothetical protein WDN46_12785 [Methylocella sp.]
MPNSTVSANDIAWTKIDDVIADLSRVGALIDGAMIICDHTISREAGCVHAILSASACQISTARQELDAVLEAVRPASLGEA